MRTAESTGYKRVNVKSDWPSLNYKVIYAHIFSLYSEADTILEMKEQPTWISVTHILTTVWTWPTAIGFVMSGKTTEVTCTIRYRTKPASLETNAVWVAAILAFLTPVTWFTFCTPKIINRKRYIQKCILTDQSPVRERSITVRTIYHL